MLYWRLMMGMFGSRIEKDVAAAGDVVFETTR